MSLPLNGKRITRKTFRTRERRTGRACQWKFAVYSPSYNLSREMGNTRRWIQGKFFDEGGRKGQEETFAFMLRTWQSEKSRSSDRNMTTIRHVSSSSPSFFPDVVGTRSHVMTGTQCLHYDTRKTNLGKFLRCIRCLTSRWLRGWNCKNGSICSTKIRPICRINSIRKRYLFIIQI